METIRLFFKLTCFIFLQITAASSRDEDTTCYPRYDFESKLLEKSITVEHRMKILEDSTKKELGHFQFELRHLKKEQNNRFQEIIKRFDILQDKLEHRQNTKFEEMMNIGNELKSTSEALVEMHKVKQDEIDMQFENFSSTIQSEITKRHEEFKGDLGVFKDEIKSKFDDKLKEMTSVKEDMNTLSDALKEEQSVKLQTVEAIGDEIKVEIQERMLKLEAKADDNKNEYSNVYKQFEETVNNTWTEIKETGFGIKPAIAFNIRDIMNTKPQSGETLKFSYALTNTQSVYDISTGLFTAPMNGTYWFSVQLCGTSSNQISFRIMVNENVFSDSTTCTQSNTCQTSDSVAVLIKGDTVHVRVDHSLRRNYYYYSSLVQSSEYTRSAFMGALVH